MSNINAEQLGVWYEQNVGPLVLYARQWLDAAGAEDVVQEAFVRLAGQKKAPQQVRAWLFRSVRNACISWMRSHKVRSQKEIEIAQAGRSWFETRIDDLLDARTAQLALEQIPSESREIVVLRIWGQLNFEEIKEVTGVPVTSLHRGYHEALRRLRKEMGILCQTKA